jgi:hypothetical protein
MANLPITPSAPNAMDMLAPSGVGQARFDQTNMPLAATLGLSPGNTVQSIPTGTERNSPIGPAIFKWDKYNFMLNAYYGTGGFYDGTSIVKSTIEKDDQYLERRSTAYYRNFVRPIIDAMYTPVFSIEAAREVKVNDTIDKDGKLVPVFTAFMKNVDAKGNCLQLFSEKIIRYSRILGISFIVMDNHPAEAIPVKTEEQINARKFPYVYMRLPQQVEPELLQLDEFGNIMQIGFREKPEVTINPITKQRTEDPRWKVWTSMFSVLYKMNDKKELEMIPGTEVFHNLNRVPVQPICSSEVEDDNFLPHPSYYDIAKCNWALYNFDSARTRLTRSQMFAMLCMPKTEGSVAATPLSGIELPTNTPEFSYPLPFYLAPPVGPYAEVGNMERDLKEDLYRLADQHGVSGVQGVNKAASGVSKSYDFQANNWVLKKSAQMAQLCEGKIAELFQLYVPSEKFEFKAQYEDNYNPGSTPDELDGAANYLNLPGLGKVAKKEALKKASIKYFEGLDDDTMQEIIDDIENTVDNENEKLPSEEEMAAQASANTNDDVMNFLKDGGKIPNQKNLPFKKKENKVA